MSDSGNGNCGGRYRKMNISYLVLEAWLQPSLPGTSVSNKQSPQPWCILANSDLGFAKQAQELSEGSDVLCQKKKKKSLPGLQRNIIQGEELIQSASKMEWSPAGCNVEALWKHRESHGSSKAMALESKAGCKAW